MTAALPILSAFLLLLGFIYARIYRHTNYQGSIPRIGEPGVLGFILTALRYTVDAKAVILEGKAKYGDQPFIVPTLVSFVQHELLPSVMSVLF